MKKSVNRAKEMRILEQGSFMDVDSIVSWVKGLFEIADYLVFKVGFLIIAILGMKALIRHHRKNTL